MSTNVFTARASSHLKSASYDPAKDRLRVSFKSGGVYDYAGVSTQRWNAFRRAPSSGGYLHRKIVPNYEDRKVS